MSNTAPRIYLCNRTAASANGNVEKAVHRNSKQNVKPKNKIDASQNPNSDGTALLWQHNNAFLSCFSQKLLGMFARAMRISPGAALVPAICALYASSSPRTDARDSWRTAGRRAAEASSEYPEPGSYDSDGRVIRLFGGSAHPTLNRQVADYLKLPTGKILLSK